MSGRTCDFAGCDRPHKTSGLCRQHYRMARNKAQRRAYAELPEPERRFYLHREIARYLGEPEPQRPTTPAAEPSTNGAAPELTRAVPNPSLPWEVDDDELGDVARADWTSP